MNEVKIIKVQPVHQKAFDVRLFLHPLKGVYTKIFLDLQRHYSSGTDVTVL